MAPIRHACQGALPVPVATLTGLVALVGCASAPAPVSQTAAARLAVVVVVDQFRAGDLARLRPLYGEGGLAGVADGAAAASFVGRYAHACTETSPGHATLSTGAAPSVHGIVLNNWANGRDLTYAVSDPKHGRGAAHLLAPTLGDTLKLATGDKAKVAAVSIKDRGAILSGGRSADAAVWFSPREMAFISSGAYPRTPAELLVKATARDWTAAAGVAESGLADPEQADLVHPPTGWGPSLPHLISELDHGSVGWGFRMTPASIEQLLDLAVKARASLGLGDDEVPDLLIVSVSTTDYGGHAFGPHSPEYVGLMAVLDGALRRFRSQIDAAVGPGRVLWALAGDHGAGPATERLKRWGKPGGTLTMQQLAHAAEAAATTLAGKNPRGTWVVGVEPPHIFLDLDPVAADKRKPIVDAVSVALSKLTGVATTFLPDDPPDDANPLEAAARLCYLPGRAGQVMVVQEEGWMYDDVESPGAANHGSPYAYDQDVPLILWGPGVRPGLHPQPVDPRDLAPTLAKLLGIPAPALAQGRVLTEALR